MAVVDIQQKTIYGEQLNKQTHKQKNTIGKQGIV